MMLKASAKRVMGVSFWKVRLRAAVPAAYARLDTSITQDLAQVNDTKGRVMGQFAKSNNHRGHEATQRDKLGNKGPSYFVSLVYALFGHIREIEPLPKGS